MYEWPLLVYTLCIQTAVGAFAVLELSAFHLKKNGIPMISSVLLIRGELSILMLAAAGTAVSFFHLGAPLHSIYVFSNLASSWLSREILLQMVFLAGLAALILFRWRWRLPSAVYHLFSLAAGAAGLTLIYAMSRLYMLPTVPTWNSYLTVVSFFVTAVLLGPLFCAAVLSVSVPENRAALQPLFAAVPLAVSAAAAVKIGIAVLRAVQQLPAGPAQVLTVIQVCVLVLYIAATVWFFPGRRPQTPVVRYLVLAAGAAVFSEILGRTIFYLMYARTGIGM